MHSSISEHDHGKGIPDGIANVVTGKVREGCAYGHHVEPGTRAHVLYLAQVHPAPRAPSAERVGLWTPGRYFYGFYDKSLWGPDEDFKMYKDAKSYHYRAGLAEDEQAVQAGLLKVRKRICGCPSCAPPNFDFGKCKVTRIFGFVQSAFCKPVKKVRGAFTQTRALSEFSESLSAGDVYAVKVAEDQTGVEGPFWFALLTTDSYQNEEECIFAGDVVGTGFLVVKVRMGSPISLPHHPASILTTFPASVRLLSFVL